MPNREIGIIPWSSGIHHRSAPLLTIWEPARISFVVQSACRSDSWLFSYLAMNYCVIRVYLCVVSLKLLQFYLRKSGALWYDEFVPNILFHDTGTKAFAYRDPFLCRACAPGTDNVDRRLELGANNKNKATKR